MPTPAIEPKAMPALAPALSPLPVVTGIDVGCVVVSLCGVMVVATSLDCGWAPVTTGTPSVVLVETDAVSVGMGISCVIERSVLSVVPRLVEVAIDAALENVLDVAADVETTSVELVVDADEIEVIEVSAELKKVDVELGLSDVVDVINDEKEDEGESGELVVPGNPTLATGGGSMKAVVVIRGGGGGAGGSTVNLAASVTTAGGFDATVDLTTSVTAGGGGGGGTVDLITSVVEICGRLRVVADDVTAGGGRLTRSVVEVDLVVACGGGGRSWAGGNVCLSGGGGRLEALSGEPTELPVDLAVSGESGEPGEDLAERETSFFSLRCASLLFRTSMSKLDTP